MALTGKLIADFSSFQSAVSQAEVSLKSFEQGGAKVETQLNRVSNSLSGTKVIAEATVMSEAVERIGGVSALTDKELAKLGRTATEAVEKAKKLGIDVPPGIQQIADASAGATGAAFGWRNALLSVGGALGVAFSVNLIKDFVVNVISTGAAIGDLSEKLGVSAEAVQRWKYAAEQSGATIDDVDKALSTMNRTLSDGSKGTNAMLEQIGLRFEDIRRMKPEDAFNAITEAIGQIEDPMLRAEAATKLFGRSGQDLLPAMVADIKKVGQETKVMSDETIARLKAAEDAWSRLKNTVVIHTGEMIGSFIQATSSLRDFAISASPILPQFVKEWLRDATDSAGGFTAALATVPPAVAKTIGAGIKPLTMSVADVDATIKYLNTTVANTATSLAMVEPKVGSLDKAIKGFKEHNEAMNIGLRFTSEVVGELPPKLEAMADSLNKVAVAQKAVTASKDAPGSVGINTGGISLGNFDAAFKAFNNIYGSNSGVGAAGPVVPDFLSWALRNGFATRGAEAVPTISASAGAFSSPGFSGATANVNVNGILMGNDPAALAQMRDLIDAAVRQAMRGEGARV